MRKIKIFAHVSLDGVISPSGPNLEHEYVHGGWAAPYRSPDGAALVAEAQGQKFDLLLGRRTYDLWAGYWPQAASSPIADGLNSATKYVATHRPESLAWGPVNALGSDLVEGISGLKASDGPDLIVWGSSTVTSVLLENGLVDEFALFVYPILLGQGLRLFSDKVGRGRLALISTKVTSSGVLMNTYQCL